MAVTVRKSGLRGLLFGLWLPVLALGAGQTAPPIPQTPESFFVRLQDLLRKKDVAGYLAAFAPDQRAGEEDRLKIFFNDLKMDSVRLKWSGRSGGDDGGTRLFCQAQFENDVSVVIESWRMTVAVRDGQWTVVGKQTLENVNPLYKVKIPSGRAEHVRSIEIRHHDIRLSFTDAAVFYDNIPAMPTALLIMGKGTVQFSPSDPLEQHQMELLYGERFLEDAIDYVYVRCSDSFASANIRIGRSEDPPPVTSIETDRAAEIFAASYPRSFTVESSLDRRLLSFPPRGDEAVFEFKCRRAGKLTYVYYPSADDAVDLYDRSKERVISLYNPVAGENPRAKRLYVSFGEKFDIDRYQLELSYSPASSYLSARARISFVAGADGLDVLKFRFNPDLEILKINDREKRELFYTQDKLRNDLYVYLIDPVDARAPGAIEVYYRGRMMPPPPVTDVAQDGGGDKHLIRKRPGSILFSKGGFWYPAPPDDDYFQARLTLIVPPEYNCVASGEMIERGRWDEMEDAVEIEKAGSSVYTFETKSPVKYMSFLVGKIERRRAGTDPVPIQTFVSSEVMDGDPMLFDEARDILGCYIRTFGPFPFEKLSIVTRSFATAGGHSPASFVVLNRLPWVGGSPGKPTADNVVGLSDWTEYFLAHEIAHQWWGQGVSFSTYKDQWLSEGLAQFSTASYLRAKHGEKAFGAILRKLALWTEKKSAQGPILFGSRLSFFDFKAYQAVVYDKAALVLFMLQDLLGRDVFFAGLREFFERHKFSAVRTDGFFAAMEHVSGRDLKGFFRGWFLSYELPNVQTSWSEETSGGARRLKIRLNQIKSCFVFPLWIEWTSGGETHSAMTIVDQLRQEIVLDVGGKVDKVRVNPRHAVPGKFS